MVPLAQVVRVWLSQIVEEAGGDSAFARLVSAVAGSHNVKGLQRQRINRMRNGHQAPLLEHVDVFAAAVGLDATALLSELLRIAAELEAQEPKALRSPRPRVFEFPIPGARGAFRDAEAAAAFEKLVSVVERSRVKLPAEQPPPAGATPSPRASRRNTKRRPQERPSSPARRDDD